MGLRRTEGVILFNDITGLNLLSLTTLVSEALCYVLNATPHQVYCSFDTAHMAFVNTLVSYHTQNQIHIIQNTQGPIDWHINIH